MPKGVKDCKGCGETQGCRAAKCRKCGRYFGAAVPAPFVKPPTPEPAAKKAPKGRQVGLAAIKAPDPTLREPESAPLRPGQLPPDFGIRGHVILTPAGQCPVQYIPEQGVREWARKVAETTGEGNFHSVSSLKYWLRQCLRKEPEYLASLLVELEACCVVVP